VAWLVCVVLRVLPDDASLACDDPAGRACAADAVRVAFPGFAAVARLARLLPFALLATWLPPW
jgi:hypothetical protein